MTGYLGRKIDLCIENRVKPQDIEHLVEPFRNRNETRLWQTEFWGKWITSAQWAYRYNGDPEMRTILDTATKKLIATQTSDGYIGNYPDDAHLQMWDIWGRKYCLLGLIGNYDITGDAATLDAARKLADHLMTEVGPGKADIVMTGNHRGMASTSVLEPIVLLYNRTGDKRYLEFAEYIVGQWEIPEGPKLISKALAGIPVAKRFPAPAQWWGWEQGMKAYEMMSCYEGLVELYRLTGQREYLDAALKTAESIRDDELNILGIGTSCECWYGGKAKQRIPTKHTMETCVVITWMKFCMQLLRATGDPVWADEIELTLYNALLGAMTPNGGDFAKYSNIEGYRMLGPNQCGMNMHCCNANGPRGLLRMPFLAVMESDEGPVVNLYERGTYHVSLPSGNRVQIEQQTDYPATGNVTLVVTSDRAEEFAVRLRIPAWSMQTDVMVNGKSVGAEPGRYLRLHRRWSAGDRIALSLDMRGRVIGSPDDAPAAAIMRGPIVLARDSRLDSRLYEPLSGLVQQDGYIDLKPVPAGDDAFFMTFRAPVMLEHWGGDNPTPAEITVCDYASAGNTWSRESEYRVWIPLVLDIMQR